MNRRSFLSTLACVPGLGWIAPVAGEIRIGPMRFATSHLAIMFRRHVLTLDWTMPTYMREWCIWRRHVAGSIHGENVCWLMWSRSIFQAGAVRFSWQELTPIV